MNKKKFKGILGISALVLVSAILILSGCSQPTELTDLNITEKHSLSGPAVKAKAYPGINLVSWGYVKDAKEYQVTRKDSYGITTVLDNAIDSLAATNTFIYFDKVKYDNQLKDQESYTYTVTAIPNDAAVYNNGVGSDSVKATIPAWNDPAVNPVWVPAADDVEVRTLVKNNTDYLEVIWQDPVEDPKTPEVSAVGTDYAVKYVYGALGESLLIAVDTTEYYGKDGNITAPGQTVAPVTPIRRIAFPLLGGTPIIEIEGSWDDDQYYATPQPVIKTGTAVTATVLPIVTGFSADRTTPPGTVTLKWTGVTGAAELGAGYDVYRTETNGVTTWAPIDISQTTIITNAALTAYAAPDTTAVVGKAYRYAIVAKADGARSSAPAFATVAAASGLTTGSAVTATAAAIPGTKDYQIAVTWSIMDGATYKLERAIIDDASVETSGYENVSIAAVNIVNGTQTVVDTQAAYRASYRYRLLTTLNGHTEITYVTTDVTTAPYSKTLPTTFGLSVTTPVTEPLNSIKVTGTLGATDVYSDITAISLYRAEVNTATPPNRISEWTKVNTDNLTFTVPIDSSTAVPTFEYTDPGLNPAVRYNYRADIFAGATQLKYADTVNPISYPSTAYTTLSATTASLNYSTDTAESVATLQLALTSASDQYKVLHGAKLYIYDTDTDAKPELLGTIAYRDSDVALTAEGAGTGETPRAPIVAYSYYVSLTADKVTKLRTLGTGSYTLITENATGQLAAVTGVSATISTVSTLSVYSSLNSAASVAKAYDGSTATAGSVTFGATLNALLPDTVIYYRVGTNAATYKFIALGTITRAVTARTGTTTVPAIGVDVYYFDISNADWLKLRGTSEILYLRNFGAVPGADQTSIYQSIGTVNFN